MKLLIVQIYPISCHFLFGLVFFALNIKMEYYLLTMRVFFLLSLTHISGNSPFRCHHSYNSTVQCHSAT